jgi:predicted protein tyrosine phosphatase
MEPELTRKVKLPEIGPNLFVRGTLPQVPDLADRLRASGCQVVLSLHRKGEPLLDKTRQNRIRYFHQELVDSSKQVDQRTVEYLAKLVAFYLDRDNGVLVACMGGRNRSALVATMGAMLAWGIPADEAIRRVKAARPTAFENQYFEKWVLAWDPSRIKRWDTV